MLSFTGWIFVLEGPDGVGKSTIANEVHRRLTDQKIESKVVNFPGKSHLGLGKLIYDIHHNLNKYGLEGTNTLALQSLHVAAHVDLLQRVIIPAIEKGVIVILDRSWWSAIVYGEVAGVNPDFLWQITEIERTLLADKPVHHFLLTAKSSYRKLDQDNISFELLTVSYARLAKKQDENLQSVTIIKNEGTIENVVSSIIATISSKLPVTSSPLKHNNEIQSDVFSISSLSTPGSDRKISSRPSVKTGEIPLPKLHPKIKHSPVFADYWHLAAERQSIFFRRFNGEQPPWTEDNILRVHKFTNTYRASDRVSQYLIRNVIYAGDYSPQDILLRILLFKFFNKIETWEMIQNSVGDITLETFDIDFLDKLLDQMFVRGSTIYSAAYLMASGKNAYGLQRKHSNHLRIIDHMLKDSLPEKIMGSHSMQDINKLLLKYPAIGNFLSYQLSTDINYSPLTNFSEMSFVVAGPGAHEGIEKCFDNSGGYSSEDIIKMVAEKQDIYFSALEIGFKDLWGRKLQLIDCQNVFCEIGKYARVKYPERISKNGRTRIKQKFRMTTGRLSYWYPPKWGINEIIERSNIREGNGDLFG